MTKRHLIQGEYAWEVYFLSREVERRDTATVRFLTLYTVYAMRCRENTIRPVTLQVLAQILFREAREWPGVRRVAVQPALWRGLDVRPVPTHA